MAHSSACSLDSINSSRTQAVLGRYSSLHQAVNDFVVCDGSVRPVVKVSLQPIDPPPAAWYALQTACGMQDGTSIDEGILSQQRRIPPL
jgi:hypothetical protein